MKRWSLYYMYIIWCVVSCIVTDNINYCSHARIASSPSHSQFFNIAREKQESLVEGHKIKCLKLTSSLKQLVLQSDLLTTLDYVIVTMFM